MLRRTLLALAALSLAACSDDAQKDSAEIVRPVRAMTVETVQRPAFSLPGTIEPRTQTTLSFRLLGRITSRPVETGDTVTAGQVLTTIDPTALDLAVQSAEADLLSAKAQLAEAAGAAFRQSELLGARATTQSSFEAADRQRKTSAAQVASAEASLAKAKEQRSYAELQAVYDGVVLSTSADVGQVVNPGQAVLTLARPEVREAVVDVPDQLASNLQAGQAFTALLELDHALTASGRIREIAPSADPATRTRRVRITLDKPPEDFRLGSTVRVFPAEAGQKRIEVPASAILTADGSTFAFIIDEGKTARRQPVGVQATDDGAVIVISGLADGDVIATAGVNSLKDGQTVRIGGEAL